MAMATDTQLAKHDGFWKEEETEKERGGKTDNKRHIVLKAHCVGG